MATRRSTESDLTAVARPVAGRAAVPLRVAIYSALAGAIRAGDPAPGSLLPVEIELCSTFGVSRTVMREALMLLEEDGLIRTKRGVGRFVVDHPPQVGLEQLQPLERMLRDRDTPVVVEPLQRGLEPTSAFTSRILDLPEEASTMIWESQLVRDGEPIALSQEWIPAESHLTARAPRLAAALRDADPSAMRQTLLAFLLDGLGASLGPASVEVTVSTAGDERGELFAAAGETPILVLTQSALLEGQPFYLAKHMLQREAGHVRVAQSSQG